MKFIHTADIHWGMIPESDCAFGKQRAQDIRDSFRRIIEKAREISADCLFISGDLFHRQPLTRDLTELNYLFSSIPSTHVVIIAGDNDYIEKSSVLLSFRWADNVHWLLSGKPESIYFDDINTEVYGLSYRSREQREPKLESLKPEDNDHIHILLWHGGDANHLPYDREKLRSLPFDYAALGHLHQPEELVEGRVVNAGSPEPLTVLDTGAHGIFIGDISPLTHRVQKLSFEEISEIRCLPLCFEVSEKTKNETLLKGIRRELERQGKKNIYQIRIEGKRNADLEFNLDSLKEEFRITDILDESEPVYDFSALYREHPTDMIGYYIRTLYREDESEMSEVEKQALYYGIHALLKTAREEH